ncbi:LysR family transcriptional regulator [Paracoccus siganidrum]|uniref:LysR family transcriptional regulator n=1 Tax=Paracoccus siganidrum TaxID=1276757 RepID=A0A419A5T7_9RHOB|nr:LysR family transcriptional regulator [Paracoccus siganidrum]RJL12340.1 LysR family transcriptional regulator [Paracoccus siganidrum]RMC26551.1 LysR family transcriptional regulator [Paracoccus siganidrum]
MRRPYDLSSMTALICFEAAARNMSFKAAANEINVTPAAVSHQIKALEQDLGCALFIRRHRGVELTEKGAFLLVALQRSFETISDTVGQLRESPETVDVTIRASTAVSALWLTPKIGAFWKDHPSVTVSQIISDVPGSGGRHDLSIRYAIPQDNGEEWRPLFHDRILALGTERFRRDQGIHRAADLLSAPLIHMRSEENDWTGWTEWFAALGHPAPKGRSLHVNNHMIALQAAQDDVGAVLGWDGLLGDLLDQGRLVRLVPESIPSPAGFHLTIHPRASARARLFADWLVPREV